MDRFATEVGYMVIGMLALFGWFLLDETTRKYILFGILALMIALFIF
jgi:hypothetical protein